MPLWKQEGSASRFRIDDKYGSPRALDVQPGSTTSHLRLEVIGVTSEDPDGTVGVPIGDLLAALQGAGVTKEDVAGVWGINLLHRIIDRPRAVVDAPQA